MPRDAQKYVALGKIACPTLAVAYSLDQAAVFTAKHLLCSLAGALALRARRQILGGQVVFVARCSNGLAAEAENAQWPDAVADPIW